MTNNNITHIKIKQQISKDSAILKIPVYIKQGVIKLGKHKFTHELIRVLLKDL